MLEDHPICAAGSTIFVTTLPSPRTQSLRNERNIPEATKEMPSSKGRNRTLRITSSSAAVSKHILVSLPADAASGSISENAAYPTGSLALM